MPLCLTAPYLAPLPRPKKKQPGPPSQITTPSAKLRPHSNCKCFKCCDIPAPPPLPPAAIFCCSRPALILAISLIRSMAAMRLHPAQFSLMRTGSRNKADTASCVSWEAPQMDSLSGLAPSGVIDLQSVPSHLRSSHTADAA